MKRRLIHKRPFQHEVISNVDETTQQEPNLREILIAYQQGKDISDYVHLPASKATAQQQFANRIAKVDPLTEIQDYVQNEIKSANKLVEKERAARSKVVESKEPKENSELKSE